MNNKIYNLLKDRYFLSGESEWRDIADRVSGLYNPIYPYILDKIFMPSSPTLFNANTKGKRIGTLSSCFPMGLEDSIEGIFEALGEAASVTKASGGVGYDFSILRSSNEVINSLDGRKSSGPLPFIDIFNSTLDGIRQAGSRMGAGMALLSINHPDIIEFIKVKEDLSRFKRFNFSVKVGTSFYEKLNNSPNSPHIVRDVSTGESYPLKDDNGEVVTVGDLWKLIMHHAWKTGEPGIFNEDIARDRCTTTNVDNRVICNPCSEYTGIFYSSCNLGSINLTKMVTERGDFDWEFFGKVIKEATIFLNKVIDNNVFPIDKIRKTTNSIRPIGLGVMGFGNLLYQLGISYESKDAISLAERISRYMTLKSMRVSVDIAKKKKKSYESFDYKTYMESNKRFFNENICEDIDVDVLKRDIKKYGIYNSSNTSIAPTGSISTIAGVSSGIEPVFALVYSRKVEIRNGVYDVMYVSDSFFEEYLKNNFNEDEKKEIIQYVSENKGSCRGCSLIPKDKQKVFVTAGDIIPEKHLDVLEPFANNVSLSVSKTINLPKDVKESDISDIYIKAYNKGIIGVTVYRDGCREGILVHSLEEQPEFIARHDAPHRPDSLPCDIHFTRIKDEKYIVLVGLLNGSLYEVFVSKYDNKLDINKHKSGTIYKKKRGHYNLIIDNEVYIDNIADIFDDTYASLSRLISMSLRHGTPLQFVVDQLQKDRRWSGFEKSVSRVLKKYIKEGEKVRSSEICPNCGGALIYRDGCKICIDCGAGHCG